MRLRIIILILSIQTLLAVVIGGYLYYSTAKEALLKEAKSQAAVHFEMNKRNLAAYLNVNIKPAKTLAGMKEMGDYLLLPTTESLVPVNLLLNHFEKTLQLEACYLINASGVAVASSNRSEPDSFVGTNFSFRPYFKESMKSRASNYLAFGITSQKRGAYYAHPVYVPDDQTTPAGVVVLKLSIDQIEQELSSSDKNNVIVADPQGIIFISTKQSWLFHTLEPLNPDQNKSLIDSKQFGKGPWTWSALTLENNETLVDSLDHTDYFYFRSELQEYPGWQFFYLVDTNQINQQVTDPFVEIAGKVALVFLVVIGIAVSILYRLAIKELKKRRAVEMALSESESRYRFIYHNTPGLLHSINRDWNLVNVSDHWLEILGYKRDEVLGRPLTDFLTPESKDLAETVIFPTFFREGYYKDIPYQIVTKNGEVIDMLSSAFGERDNEGNIVRSFSVSVNISKQKSTERELKKAKEDLSEYSKNLERTVKKRTSEISNLLKYTPAVVYLKRDNGSYTLVNSRFEELVGLKTSKIIGKKDAELFSQEIAQQLIKNDQTVYEAKESRQTEEQFQLDGITHTFLTVRFPIYGEFGDLNGIGGISTDISALKKAEDKLRRFSRQIIYSQEAERSAIARELHDELGQILTAFSLEASWLANQLKGNDEKVYERVTFLAKQIDQTISEVRNISIRLRPGVLDDLGLIDALEWLANDFEKRTQTSCVFKPSNLVKVQDQVDNTIATAIYRITQEALTNITRHAEAGSVEIRLAKIYNHLVLSIMDDGKGFKANEEVKVEGLGLVGMQERSSLVGGEFEIQSIIGEGTTVNCMIPLFDNSMENL